MFIKKVDKLDWPAKHFSIKEISNESQRNTFVFNEKLIDTLILVDQPVYVSDGCRFDEKYSYSQHYFKKPFNALDIYTKGYSSIDLMKVIEENDLGTGRGLYPGKQGAIDENTGFIHIDTRRGLSSKNGRVSRWYQDRNGNYRNYGEHYNDKPFDGLLE